MPDRRYTILSTASIPFERIPQIPDSVDLQVIPFIEIIPRDEESLKKQIISLADRKNNCGVYQCACCTMGCQTG